MSAATGSTRRAAVFVLLALLAGCGGEPRPSVLLVTIDTLRADVLGPWGGAGDVAPALSGLASGGTAFLQASTVTPLTLPAHASLLTGLRPARHGLTVNGVSREELPTPTLAEHLAASGLATGAFVSALVLDRQHGLDRGFDHYDDDLALPGAPPMPLERRGDATVDRAAAWIARQAGAWFAWVHLYDPHAPYAAPGGPAAPPREAYLAEVAFADQQFGRLLAALPADSEVLVVVTSDHGEGLGDHGEATHGVYLHETTMRVPLVIARRGAGGAAASFPAEGERRPEPVSLLDVTPTVLALLDLPIPAGLDGVPVIDPRPDRFLPLECRSPFFYYGLSPLAGVRSGSLKLIAATRSDPPGFQLVDLSQDPAERAPRAVAEHALSAHLPVTEPAHEAVPTLDEQSLAALGYLEAAARPQRPGPLADPRGATDLIAGIDAANTALVGGDPAAAIATLLPLRRGHGDVAELELFLGKAQRALGDVDAAVASLARAHALQPGSPGILKEWGKSLLERDERTGGDGAAGRAALEQALALVPDDPEAVALLALADLGFGSAEAALARLEPVLARRPHAANLLLVKARALERLGRHAEAATIRASLPDPR